MFSKTWKVAVLAASISTAFASENQQPLFTSLPSGDQLQAQIQNPLLLTNVADQKTNLDTLAEQVFAFEDKVWLVSSYGVSVSERTATGLVKRVEYQFAKNEYNQWSSQKFVVSPNGKRLLSINTGWGSPRGKYLELTLADDFKLTERAGSFSSSSSNIDSIDTTPNGFITRIWNSNVSNYLTTYYKFTDNGIEELGTTTLYGGLFSPNKNVAFFTRVNYNWPTTTINIFAVRFLADGNVLSTNTSVTSSNYRTLSAVFLFDEVRNKLILSEDSDGVSIDFDPTTGVFGNVTRTNSIELFGTSWLNYQGSMTDDYSLNTAWSPQVLQRTATGYAVQTLTMPQTTIRSPKLLLNKKTNALELWSIGDDGDGAQLHKIEQNKLVADIKQSKADLGFTQMFQNGTQISSADSPLLFLTQYDNVQAYKIDANKGIIRIDADVLKKQGANNGSIHYLGNNQYFFINSNRQALLLKEAANNQLTLLHTLNLQPYADALTNQVVVSGNNVLLQSYEGLMQLSIVNDKITYVGKATASTNPLLLSSGNSYLATMGQKIFMLQPDNRRYHEIKLSNGAISVEQAGAMPNVQINRVAAGIERFFISTNTNSHVTLVKNTNGDLVTSAIDYELGGAVLLKKRFAVRTQYSLKNNNFFLNDAQTGIWSSLNLAQCCENDSRMFSSGDYVLAYDASSSPIGSLKTFKANSAPYLPTVQPTLKLNQGVAQTLNLTNVVTDDEKDSLTFSGTLPAGFSVNAAGVLSFDGSSAGAGHYNVTVADAALSTDLRLPYSINAAPALEKALPKVTVNEKQRLSFELSDYFSDIEGQAISFSAESQNGLSISRSGLISGTPSSTQSTELAFKATDSAGAISNHKITVAVNAAPVWTSVTTQSFTEGDSVKIELSGAFTDREGGSLSLQASNLPAGLTLTGSTITGTPTKPGDYTVAVQATDAGGAVGAGSFNITVHAKKSGGSSSPIALLMLAAIAVWRRRHTTRLN